MKEMTESAFLRSSKEMLELFASHEEWDAWGAATSDTARVELVTAMRDVAAARGQKGMLHLALVEERKDDYVLSTDVPLSLLKEQRRLQEVVATHVRYARLLQTLLNHKRLRDRAFEDGFFTLDERINAADSVLTRFTKEDQT